MTEQKRQVRDIMIDVFDFPHVPYWFTLRQVSGILKKSLSGNKCLRPLAVLIFDEKYNLVGHLDERRIIRGIGDVLFPVDEERVSSASPGGMKTDSLRELSEKPVSTLMHSSHLFIDPEDSVSRAAEVMIRNNLEIIPVLENHKKLIGIVRPLEVFKELTEIHFRT